jgi:N-acetylmuramate 1-kinase
MKNLHHEMLAFIKQSLSLKEDASVEMKPVARSGSKRSFYRVFLGGKGAAVFMHYDRNREENNYYAAIAGFLPNIGVAVPRIMAHDAAMGFVVMEDLGSKDLWSVHNQTWEVRRGYYRKTLAVIHRLHAYPLEDFPSEKVPLMEDFGPDLYKWERDYFYENFVKGACGIELRLSEKEALEEELRDLSGQLENIKLCLVHRDFQSRNVMIFEEEPFLIDFQGARRGNFFYDLGSLLYDPYVILTDDERIDLLRYYFDLVIQLHRPCLQKDIPANKDQKDVKEENWMEFQEMFREASVQRLMQALGAYGFLGLKGGKPEFLTHIPNGLGNIMDIVSRLKRLPVLGDLLGKCRSRRDQALTPHEKRNLY